MSMEFSGGHGQDPLPEEITVDGPEFKVNAEGKRYLVEENGSFYGGDYLAKPPAEIDSNDGLPPPPEEIPHPAL